MEEVVRGNAGRCAVSAGAARGRVRRAALGALLLAAPSALAATAPPGQLVVVTDDNYPPYLFRADDGQLQGILMDKWALWSKTTGVPVKVEGMAWGDAQQRLQAGNADVIDALAYTATRAGKYEFSQSYATVEARVFFHHSIGGINQVASLRGFTIGAKEGSACASWLEQRGIDTIRKFPASEGLVRAAGAGEIRLFCMDSPTAQYFLFKHKLADDFRQTAPLYSASFHWAVAAGRADLRDSIQRGYDRIPAQALADIDARWLGSPLSLPIDPRYFYYFVAFAAAIFFGGALLFLWNRTLRTRVESGTAEASGQKRVLEMVAAGAPLNLTLDALVRFIEARSPGMLGSILLLDAGGTRVRHGAGPSLPESYNRAVDGQPIGPRAGSCGTAAYRHEMVIVEDIATDPLWDSYRPLATEHGLRACWSTPIFDPQRRVLGTFAMYFREPRRPGPGDLRLIEMATHTAAIAIIRTRDEQERARLVHDLGERVKELQVLHASARLLQSEHAVDFEMIAELAGLLPRGWQFPEICVARVVYGSIEAQTPGWRDTAWRQSARFTTGDGQAGLIEVAYLEERPADAEGPFLREERRLIDSLAELIGEHFERMRIQNALRESEARVRLAVHASHIGLWDWDIAGDELYYSPEWKSQLGYAEDEIDNTYAAWRDRLHPEDREKMLPKIRAYLADPRGSYEAEFRLHHKDGSYRWIYSRAHVESDAEGRPQRMLGCHIDVTERKEAEEALQRSLTHLQELSRRLVEVEETERRNINRELHDRVGQNLSALGLSLGVIRNGIAECGSQELNARLDDARTLLEMTSKQVRDVMAELRPAALDDYGLIAALRHHVATVAGRLGIPITVEGKDPDPRLPAVIETALFRIAQEALNNVAKHARARCVSVALDEASGRVRLSVTDDGAGFDTARRAPDAPTYGIVTMHERAEAVGARLKIESAPGRGTRVEAEVAKGAP